MPNQNKVFLSYLILSYKKSDFYCFPEKYKGNQLSLKWAIFHFGYNLGSRYEKFRKYFNMMI